LPDLLNLSRLCSTTPNTCSGWGCFRTKFISSTITTKNRRLTIFCHFLPRLTKIFVSNFVVYWMRRACSYFDDSGESLRQHQQTPFGWPVWSDRAKFPHLGDVDPKLIQIRTHFYRYLFVNKKIIQVNDFLIAILCRFFKTFLVTLTNPIYLCTRATDVQRNDPKVVKCCQRRLHAGWPDEFVAKLPKI
jgi:hypothetical protein